MTWHDPKPERVAMLLIITMVGAGASSMAAGAVSTMEPANQFYGDRNGGVRDQNGNTWWIGTHVEDVSGDEMKRRMAEEVTRREAAAARA